MKAFLYLLFLTSALLMLTESVFASNPTDQMAKANELAAGGKYQEAIAAYEALIGGGQESCVLYYNLGTAYFKSGNLSKAIVNYERARRISPKDEAILHNLKIVNKEVKFPVNNLPTLFYVRWWKNIVNTFSPTTWGILCLLCLWGAFATFGLFVYRKEAIVQKRSFYGAISLALLAILLFLFTYSRYQYYYNTPQAIVKVEETPLQLAPSDDSEMATSLTEGVKVSVKDQLDNWVKVSLSDGREGWIALEDVERI